MEEYRKNIISILSESLWFSIFIYAYIICNAVIDFDYGKKLSIGRNSVDRLYKIEE